MTQVNAIHNAKFAFLVVAYVTSFADCATQAYVQIAAAQHHRSCDEGFTQWVAPVIVNRQYVMLHGASAKNIMLL